MINFVEFTRKHQEQNLFLVFSCEFCKICKNTFFTEQHWTTASDYSSIHSSEESTGNQTVNYETRTKAYVLLKREVQVKEQVPEAGVCRLQIRCSLKFCKFHKKISVLESIFNKAAGLKVCNSIKKRLQHSCLPVKLAKFLKTSFFTEEFRWLLLTFNSCSQRSSEQKQV